jgi:hypothetical protein
MTDEYTGWTWRREWAGIKRDPLFALCVALIAVGAVGRGFWYPLGWLVMLGAAVVVYKFVLSTTQSHLKALGYMFLIAAIIAGGAALGLWVVV